MCKIYTGYYGTIEIEHGFCACTVDNPLAKARGLSLRTGAQTMLYLSLSLSTSMVPAATPKITLITDLEDMETGARKNTAFIGEPLRWVIEGPGKLTA